MKHNEKGLSVFSLTMLALGTVIGGSFFLGIAFPISNSGPSVILAYILCGFLVYFILYALSEMTVNNPSTGSFRKYAQNAFGKGTGFVVGWVYWTGLVIAMSSEAVAVSILFQVFFPRISISLLGSIVIIVVIVTNLLGTKKLSVLESFLAGIKILAIIVFIIIGVMVILGITGTRPHDITDIDTQPFLNNGFRGLAGSTVVVIFSYAGFEIIGLAATETKDPEKNIPRAIFYTVLALVGLYLSALLVLLPLIPVKLINENISPFVAALLYNNINYAARAINVILIVAILSTMLAATFGVARMLRSLAEENFAPKFLKDKGDIPYRGILFSGIAMFVFFSLSFFLPKSVYLFLVSSSGFALLFTYLIIVLSHYKYRKKHGCKDNKCQLPIFPFSSWFTIIALLVVIISMPFVEGQGAGLLAGIILVVIYTLIYFVFYRQKLKM